MKTDEAKHHFIFLHHETPFIYLDRIVLSISCIKSFFFFFFKMLCHWLKSERSFLAKWMNFPTSACPQYLRLGANSTECCKCNISWPISRGSVAQIRSLWCQVNQFGETDTFLPAQVRLYSDVLLIPFCIKIQVSALVANCETLRLKGWTTWNKGTSVHVKAKFHMNQIRTTNTKNRLYNPNYSTYKELDHMLYKNNFVTKKTIMNKNHFKKEEENTGNKSRKQRLELA